MSDSVVLLLMVVTHEKLDALIGYNLDKRDSEALHHCCRESDWRSVVIPMISVWRSFPMRQSCRRTPWQGRNSLYDNSSICILRTCILELLIVNNYSYIL